MHVMFSYRKAFYIAVTLFWLVTMGMLMQRHYGTFTSFRQVFRPGPSEFIHSFRYF